MLKPKYLLTCLAVSFKSSPDLEKQNSICPILHRFIVSQVKSGATKRREKAAAREEIAHHPKLTHFLKPLVQTRNVSIPTETETNNSDCHYLNTRVESDRLICESTSNGTTILHNFLSDDPSEWPDNVSDAQRCDIVKRGFKKIKIDFPYNLERRRFSLNYYNRKMKNGEIFERTWLIYSLNSNKVFCFCCKLFGISSSPFWQGMNTWEGLSKKLKEHETCSAHFKCFEQWMTLGKGIANQATIDEKQQKLLHKERIFWRAVLERILDITLFLSARNLAFRGSDTAICSKSNGNFLGVFELQAKDDIVLNELMQRIQDKETKEHYLSNDTQNELIRLLATEIESKNLSKVKIAKYYSIILDCTPDVSHKEQMSIILQSVTCTPGVGIDIYENFFGYLTVNDTKSGKKLGSKYFRRGQSYDNAANMKVKVKGVQAIFLEMNLKALYVPCANHSLNLVIVDGALSSISAISFFGILSKLYTLFLSSPPRWEILKSCVAISVKPQSDTRLEKKRDGATATEVRSLTEYIRTWPFLLSIIIWYEVLFQINKSRKLLQSSATSLDILASEINATKAFLYEYRENGFSDARVKASEIAKVLGIEKVFSMVRSRKKKSIYSYECADHTWQPEHQYKADFFLPLIDMSIASVKERFEQISIVTKLYDFLYRSESLIKACNENSLSAYCKNLQIKLADIDSEDLESELKRFVVVIKEGKNALLKSAYDFLNYIYKEELQETYPNLVIALQIIITLPVTVASAEHSFSKSTMVDERLSSLAMLSIENEVARTLSYEGIINEFASMKTPRKSFF
ncbi:zinc finger MYM-type protein 1-like [Hydra vulgaris]|uniref:Zinc finger MYM-type protein 1-like n=1 Tax=Hydra vulgaris TaxID=6087 RepID=A0ABM4B9I3_HYDVU